MPPDHPTNLLLVNTLRKVWLPFILETTLHNHVLPRTWKALPSQESVWPWTQSSSILWKTQYPPSRPAFTISFLIIRQYTSSAAIKYILFTFRIIKTPRSSKDPSCAPGSFNEATNSHRTDDREGAKATQRPRLWGCKHRSHIDSRPRPSGRPAFLVNLPRLNLSYRRLLLPTMMLGTGR